MFITRFRALLSNRMDLQVHSKNARDPHQSLQRQEVQRNEK